MATDLTAVKWFIFSSVWQFIMNRLTIIKQGADLSNEPKTRLPLFHKRILFSDRVYILSLRDKTCAFRAICNLIKVHPKLWSVMCHRCVPCVIFIAIVFLTIKSIFIFEGKVLFVVLLSLLLRDLVLVIFVVKLVNVCYHL